MMKPIDSKLPKKLAVYKFSNGVERQINSDKSEVIRFPNGNKEFWLPDGRVIYYRKGTTVTCTGPKIFHPLKVKAAIAGHKIHKALHL